MTEPSITLLCCRNARSALASPSGQEELPPGVTIIELPCSGRIDEAVLLRALRTGAWSVLVVGCLEGNCRYHSGNYQARRRVDEARSILVQIGMDPQRIRMINIASNQHARLAAVVGEVREAAKKLGPASILEGDNDNR